MTDPNANRVVLANPRIPATIGSLNLIFGTVLVLLSLGTIAWSLGSPLLADYFRTRTQAERMRQKADLETKLAGLKQREAAGKSAAEKSAIRAEIDALEAEIDLDFLDLGQASPGDWKVTVPFWADTILGLVSAALLLISGVGLVALRPWGRSLALWVAGFKLAWLTLSTAYALSVTIPLETAQVHTYQRKLVARQGPPGPAGLSLASRAAAMSAAGSATFALGGFAVGALYPAITLWLLNKPTAKVALLAASRERRPANAP